MASTERTFEPVPHAVAEARAFVRSALQRWGFGAAEKPILVVSELATNAVRHARGHFGIKLQQSGDSILIEVSDPSPEPILVATADPVTESGRGLRIVAHLARDWGSRQNAAGGKVVWADVPL